MTPQISLEQRLRLPAPQLPPCHAEVHECCADYGDFRARMLRMKEGKTWRPLGRYKLLSVIAVGMSLYDPNKWEVMEVQKTRDWISVEFPPGYLDNQPGSYVALDIRVPQTDVGVTKRLGIRRVVRRPPLSWTPGLSWADRWANLGYEPTNAVVHEILPWGMYGGDIQWVEDQS